MKFFPCIFLIACLGLGCEKFELDRQEIFVQVQMAPPEGQSINSARLSAEILEWQGVTSIKDHGFIWFSPENAQEQQEPDLLFNQGISLGAITTPEAVIKFETVISSLAPTSPYIFRAYVSTGDEVFYSDSQTYQTGTGGVSTVGFIYQTGPNIEMHGQLFGTQTGITALRHGFCWSASNPLPTLTDSLVDLGVERRDASFSFTLTDLQDEQELFIRAFAILYTPNSRDTVYGNVETFDGNLNYWIRRNDWPGGFLSEAVAFAIGERAYIATGSDGSNFQSIQDFWEYDPSEDTWTQLADFPGPGREEAVGFSIGDKGYVGTGRNFIQGDVWEDFWEYDPQTNTWRELPPFEGGPRREAVGFSIGDKGYVGTGVDENGELTQDFWEYDPQEMKWTPLSSFEGDKRQGAVGFSIGNKGYIGTGHDFSAERMQDFWEYDPQNNDWIRKADFAGGGREDAVGFSLGNRGYLGTGFGRGDDLGAQKDFWEYDLQTNAWTRRGDVSERLRASAVGFSIGPKGYLGIGIVDVDGTFFATKDFWEYDP